MRPIPVFLPIREGHPRKEEYVVKEDVRERYDHTVHTTYEYAEGEGSLTCRFSFEHERSCCDGDDGDDGDDGEV